MKKQKRRNVYLRMLAIFMALCMVLTLPINAFAQDLDAEEISISEDHEVMTEDQGEDFFDSSEVIEDEIEVSDDSDTDADSSDEIQLDTDDSVFLSEDALQDKDTIEVTDEVETPDENEFTAEDALEILKNSGSYPSQYLGSANIPTSEYKITRYADRVSVSNLSTGEDDKDYLYAALIFADETKKEQIYMLGSQIAPGKSVDLYVAYNNKREKVFLDENTDYILWLGRADYEEIDGKKEYYSFKILGYLPEYEDGEIKTDSEGNIIYVGAEMDEIGVPKQDTYDGYDGEWKDGYSGIKMKAMLQKDLTTVKITWTLDTKNKPEQKNFKKYAIYRLDKDDSAETGYKETFLPTNGKLFTAKSFTHKNVNVEKDSLIYLLKCFDNTGTQVLGQFVTTAAPYFLKMQSGESTGKFDFIMNKRPDEAAVYKIQVATQNKERDGLKNINGFQEDWTTLYPVDDGFNEGYSIGKYFVNSKLWKDTTRENEAIQLTYKADDPEAKIGTTYYGRIQTITYVNGLKVNSAPSNVLSCKAGPQKCFILTSAGVYYDANNAKKGNAANIERANEHINAYFNGTEISANSGIYCHESNVEVCAKCGLIYFVVDKDISGIKSFDLLKCDYPNGTYKKIKNYVLKNTNTQLMECTVSAEYMSGYRIYAMYYNNFIPEKDAYYAVRAISTTKSTPGGQSGGVLIRPEMDVVQALSTSSSGVDKISLSWLADDCVKQYWLYRSERSSNGADRERAGQFNDILIAKIGIGSAKKYVETLTSEIDTKTIKYISYTDKKNLKVDTNYYYYVRPVYNTTLASKNSELYMSYCSQEVKGKASALYSQIKNFKGANDSIGKIKVSFNQIKTIKHYRVFRLQVANNVTKLTDDMKPNLDDLYNEAYKQDYEDYSEFEDFIAGHYQESDWIREIEKAGTSYSKWKYVDTIHTDGKATSAKSLIDDEVRAGCYYFYLIQGATDESSSINFTYSGRVRNMPLPVTNAKAEYNGSGSIKVTWSYNSKDKGNLYISSQISRDGGKNYIDVSKNEYVDHNVSRGSNRSYIIRVRYNDGNGDVYSSGVTVSYSLPSGIEVTHTGGDGSLENNTFTIKKGQSAKLSFRAYLSNGETAAYNHVSRSETPSDNNTVIVTESGGNSFSFYANQTGYVNYYLSCAGLSRAITIRVIE